MLVFAVGLLTYLVIIGLTHLVAQERMQDHLDLERTRTTNEIEASIDRYEAFSNYLHEAMITDEVLELMNEANDADDSVKSQARNELETLLEDEYLLLRDYSFRQFHFHLPTGESFLRLHAPERYGDMLFDIRESVRIANTENVYVSGFEEGRIHNGYRFVYPLTYEGEHVGSVEISISYEAVIDTLYTVSPNEDAFFILKEQVVLENLFDDFSHNYEPSALSDVYLVDSEIYSRFENDRYNLQGEALERFLSEAKPQISSDLEKETSFSYPVQCDDCHYVLHFTSVKNMEDEHVGYLFTLSEDIHYSDMVRENRTNIGLITLFFIILFALLFVSAKDKAKLRQLSRKDPLTGLANRLFFTTQVEALLAVAKREDTKLSLIMIDIDDFKDVNDTCGHAEGDKVLTELSHTFTDTLRESDIIGRWGGEEFLIALPKTGESSALKVAEKIRRAVRNTIKTSNNELITISLGIATTQDSQVSFDTLVKRADEALYQSKNNGKDQATPYNNTKDD